MNQPPAATPKASSAAATIHITPLFIGLAPASISHDDL
jgi:hypothetical protein